MELQKAYTLTVGNHTFALDYPRVTHSGSATIQPNVYNDFGHIDGLIEITKGSSIPSVANIYIIRFSANVGATVLFNGWHLMWADGIAPVFTDNTVVEILIIDNLATFIKYENA